jgi:hypothetical protein
MQTILTSPETAEEVELSYGSNQAILTKGMGMKHISINSLHNC